MNDPQPLINAIVNQIGDADDSRSQRFLDDLRQEGVLPGRRSRLAHRLRRGALTLRGWCAPIAEHLALLFRGRQPASYWLELMDELIADGRSPDDAAREVKWKMSAEDWEQGVRWFSWIGILVIAALWALAIFVFENS